MDETSFHAIADRTLATLADGLEEGNPPWEVEYRPGSLEIELPDRRHFLLSKHGPTRQIWLSSPLSGGLHFSYEASATRWVLPDGRELEHMLRAELAACTEEKA